LKTSRLAVLFASVLVDMMGFGIVLPLLPFYAESMGATPFQVTIIIASFSAMQLAAAPVWGRVSDRHGRRPLIVAGLFASSVSYLIFGLAQSLTVLLLSRLAAGAAGGTISVAQAYVADATDEEGRAHGLGLLGAASGLGILFGPMIGGFFATWGYAVPGFVAAGLCAANGVAAVLLLPESRGLEERRPDAGEASTMRGWFRAMVRFPLNLLLSVYFLCITSFTAMTAVLALYLERVFGLGASAMGIVFSIAGGATVVVRGGIVGWLVHRLGEPHTVRLGAIVLAASLIAVAWIPTANWLGVVVPVWAFGTGILFPSLASLVSRATDRQSQGSILGGSQIVGGTGRVLGPIWAGLLFQHIGITSPFTVGAVLVAMGVLLSLRIPNPRRLRPAGAPQAGSEANAPVGEPGD
jgi:MFS transporter, DHA1 family, tetracycline resistance protein